MSVGCIDAGCFDFGDEGLVVEDLTDVRDIATCIGAVLELGAVEVDHDMSVSCATSIVPWEESGELSDTIGVGGLETAEEGVVQVRGIQGTDSISAGDNAGVDTGGVAVPDFEDGVGDGLAGLDVENLGVENHGNTFLVFADVLTDEFPLDPVWSLSDFWGEDARAVRSEES